MWIFAKIPQIELHARDILHVKHARYVVELRDIMLLLHADVVACCKPDIMSGIRRFHAPKLR